MDNWRLFLYYPLGLLPSLFFTLRFLIQWLRSEKVQVSYVDALFWKLSLAGNLLLLSHYFIQGQLIFAFIQVGNAVIAWRNLNIMQKERKPASFLTVMLVFASCFVAMAGCCWLRSEGGWLQVPLSSKSASLLNPGLFWHLIGFFGQALFASRFWIQWWQSEQQRKSELRPAFWWLSILGSLFSVAYFLQIRDMIGILNQSFGIVPYVRNLLLIRKKRTA